MDFLEIRRKAKARAAARAAAEAEAEARAAASGQQEGAPAPEATASEPRPPLALDPTPLAAAPAEEAPAPLPDPFAVEPRPGGRAVADEVAAEAARIEAELAERLGAMPPTGDSRFLTWRPGGGRAEVTSAEPTPPRHAPAAPAREAPRPDRARPPSPEPDPLDEFFYREGEDGAADHALGPPTALVAAAGEPVERVEYLTFLLGAEEYGVEIERVREVMRSPPITEVPRAPAGVLGVITVRGEVVAVFDPRRRLGLPPARGDGSGRLVIVDDGAGPCGLLVDAVASVVRLPRGTVEPCPHGMGGRAADCLAGIGRDRDRLFTVLDVGALLRGPGRAVEGRPA
jgi:purine-binding chemotaxis protein CheW